MIKACLVLMLSLLLAPAWAAGAKTGLLLWITLDVTPAARSALIEREAAAAGLAFKAMDYPLRSTALDASQARELAQALSQAQLVWIDAPHPSVEAKLRAMLGQALKQHAIATPVWIAAGEPAAGDRSLRAYLQAGGIANTRHAFALVKAQLTGQPAPDLPLPTLLPQRGLYLPGAPGLFANAQALSRWAEAQGDKRPAVALLLHRYHFVQGATAWIDDWLQRFDRQGLLAYAVFSSRFSEGTAGDSLAPLMELPDGKLHASVIVNHALLPQSGGLQPLFNRWGAPLLQTLPYRSGGTADWEASETGLSMSDLPFYFAQPEGAGAIDPLMVVAHANKGSKGQEGPQLIGRQAEAVIAKARRLIVLQTKPASSKRLVAFVYNYPPGGDHFGASFLNVPRSLERVSMGLREAGYGVQPLPEAEWIAQLKPLIAAYYPSADLQALLARDQAAALPLADYEAWFKTLPAALQQHINGQWGEPARSRYIVSHEGRPVFVIPRLQRGGLSVLPQPPREETLRRGQDPFMHKNKTPISHHYLATYLWARQADALIHFGTHGTQEWAPGKLRALDIHDEALLPLGDVPVIYPYIVDNLGEGLTAKRRGRALMVSHRTPSFAPAGFNARMAHMHELMHEWETVDAGPTRQALERQMVSAFVEHQLHRDLGWTAQQIAADFSGFLELLHPWLDRLAQSSQPKGLAVFGQVPHESARHTTILQMLRQPLIEALGEDIDEAFLINHESVATSRPARWLHVALKDAQAASTLDLRPPEPQSHVPNRASRKAIDTPALLQLAERAQELERRLSTEGEMPGLLAALQGRFLPAAYGGDPLRNPDSLPTGRNLTGLDPSRLPTKQAYEVAQRLFAQWYEEQAKTGKPPQRLALSLWAGETLRHQGLMESQALAALGVQPIWDDSGRPTGVKPMPLAELKGRPRVDVLLSITGSYRDQFPALMNLLDQAVAAAAAAEPGNIVARNTATVAAELRRQGLSKAEALALAQARVFGNASGDYGTGISEAAQDNGLKADDARLGQLFLQRMSQPYVNGEPLRLSRPAVAAQALGAHLKHTDAALMSRSSHLYAMLSSDDPFQYLGGLSAAAKAAGRKDGLSLHVSQLQDATELHTESAASSLAMEMQSRYLHPGWLKAQQAEGWAGALQVLKAVQYTFGWQAIAPGTVRPDHWQSLYDTLVRDKQQLGLPEWLKQNKQAYAQALERMIQAERLGYWKPDAATREQLAATYQSLSSEAGLHQELAAVRQWAADQLHTPVSQATASPAAPATAEAAPPPPPSTRGLLLEQQQPPQDLVAPQLQNQLSQALAWVAMALLMSLGAVWQARRPALPATA
ncbi:cobaltochelatase subunit CobN [Paucibacter sp. PLA-PC-4]|uniref:cobaltochelatase subunit CobN n=1 Tax=Paucibacter sp. PLA-PC-4 TaxID=2993655 RepID=UPI002249918C|nr:cobaltochelatase subunit CobN [Paucibacter sp. PLA-PC-4]MCX2863113.1 cobaltochelatase subunit CobN [Paucibacter sp. PLA-PC-4]